MNTNISGDFQICISVPLNYPDQEELGEHAGGYPFGKKRLHTTLKVYIYSIYTTQSFYKVLGKKCFLFMIGTT